MFIRHIFFHSGTRRRNPEKPREAKGKKRKQIPSIGGGRIQSKDTVQVFYMYAM